MSRPNETYAKKHAYCSRPRLQRLRLPALQQPPAPQWTPTWREGPTPPEPRGKSEVQNVVRNAVADSERTATCQHSKRTTHLTPSASRKWWKMWKLFIQLWDDLSSKVRFSRQAMFTTTWLLIYSHTALKSLEPRSALLCYASNPKKVRPMHMIVIT